MASGIVQSFISECCVEAEGTSFSRLPGEFTTELLKRILANSDETTLEAFNTFSEELAIVFTLKKIFIMLKDYKVVTTQQEKLW